MSVATNKGARRMTSATNQTDRELDAMVSEHPTDTFKGIIMHCTKFHRLKPKSALMACAAGLSFFASPASAQKNQVDGEKILELLVARGVITRTDADGIIAQAETVPALAQQASIPQGGVAGDTQTVPYIPQTVRNQIKEELRAEVIQQAKTEGWAAPGQTAEWTQRIKVSGDLRARFEGIYFDKPRYDPASGLQTSGNYPLFPDFQALNAGSGFDVNGFNGFPIINNGADRQRERIRARLGITAQIDDWISADLRIATGNDRSPVSTNQTLGSGAQFGKYQLWLDRASIRLRPLDGVSIDIGRSANPFWSTDLLFDEDLNFDGVSVAARRPVMDDLTLFGTVGAFPVYNTDFNFGTFDTVKAGSKDRYLLAAQAGAEFKLGDKLKIALAAGYFDYRNIRGELSSPCFASLVSASFLTCDTDITRPQFVQFGNTLAPIRNIVPDPNNPDGPQFQYFGLASQFRILNVHGKVDFVVTEGIYTRLEGDFAHNLGYNRGEILAQGPINNLGDGGVYQSGANAWYANLIAGKIDITERGDWNASLGYKYLEADAVLDALNDSDFHLGGTNAEGFIIGGHFGIAKNTFVGARWLSANEVSGPPYAVDVLQIDLATKF